jgi:acetylornithine deacetylase/succinyl-diaminopimelate desuccinylase-like protein
MINQKYIEMLSQFVSFKSISTDPAYKPEILKTVNWLEKQFVDKGFIVEKWQGPKSNPVVFATYIADKSYETVLVYGHYDVQPAEKEDGWDSDPYQLAQRKGRLYARGVVDNKGQILVHIVSVFEAIANSSLKYNVKFLIEGNEETSNEDLGKLLKKNKVKAKADYILLSDGEIPFGRPVVEYSLRGGFNLKVKYTTAKNNLHSGLFGGAVPNAAVELSKFLSKIHDSNGNVLLPNFMSGVDEITKAQLRDDKALIKDIKGLYEMTGVKRLTLPKGIDFYTRVGLMPTVQVTGIKSGYIGDGYSNIVPNTAEARINFRTVKSQNNEKILEAFKKFVDKNTPKYVDYEITHTEPYESIKVDITAPKVAEVKELLKQAYGETALTKPVGGGLPVVSDFKDQLGLDTLLVSLGNDDCNMHGVNENFDAVLVEKALRFSKLFFNK